MNESMNSKNNLAHLLMIIMVFIWGIEYVIVNFLQQVFPTVFIVMMKYICTLGIIAVVKIVRRSHSPLRKKDLIAFICCSLFGQIFYFLCSYTAMDYIPAGMVTVILALLPACSVITERLLYKRKTTMKAILGIVGSILGVCLIIGVDIQGFSDGQMIGYLLGIAAVLCFNCFNFITESISGHYDSLSLTFNQILCTVLLITPIAAPQFPGLFVFEDIKIVGLVLLHGVVCSGFGFIIYVFSLTKLGSTTAAVYNNFLPVTTVFFGWILLNESLSGMQIAGSALTILSGLIVIKEKAPRT